MKLYYSPGACSLASHITLREVGATFDLEKVDVKQKRTERDADFWAINPKGYVPALALDSGEVLTEGAAILQYIADQHPQAGLAPANGGLERARLQEQLNFVAAELHKAFSPLFNPAASESEKTAANERVGQKLDVVEKQLSDGRSFLLGEDFSVADAYLFVVAGWTKHLGIALDNWPRVAAFQQRIGARESVQTAMKAEGLAA
ncbi:MAG: glutathione transferase GstA [Kiloniellaceae bacterium]|nr:glutathione transferase GstA [Kiloniellaceae bacterium]